MTLVTDVFASDQKDLILAGRQGINFRPEAKDLHEATPGTFFGGFSGPLFSRSKLPAAFNKPSVAAAWKLLIPQF